MGGTRLLKTMHVLQTDSGGHVGHVCAKVYCKRDKTSLASVQRAYEQLRVALASGFTPSVLPYAQCFETEKGGFLLRQHFAHSLFERFDKHPLLTLVEKKWLAFQLVHAVAQMHAVGVCHGASSTSIVC